MRRRSTRIAVRQLTVNELRDATSAHHVDEAENDYAEEEESFDEATDSEQDNNEMDFEANHPDEDDSSDEEMVVEINETPQFYYGRDNTEWKSEPYSVRNTLRSSQTQYHKVVIPLGKHLDEVYDCFRVIFDDPIIDIIVQYTNIEALKHNVNWKNVDRDEILAFIGLLIAAGVDRSSKKNYREFYGRLRGLPLFKACMSRTRFAELLRFIRFDDKNNRNVRRSRDKLAPIRDIFYMFIKNLKRLYLPGKNLTIDEQLVPFRGRCAFKQYLPSKPDKYGLKIFWICDAEIWYPLNALAYLGRERSGSERRTNIALDTVKQLCEPYERSKRNITFDNFFISYDLAQELKQKGLTCVGTVRKNKKFIPREFLPHRQREVDSNLFGFRPNVTLVSYVPKRNKAVILLSTLHHTADVNNEGKSEINLFYNNTKTGVDVLDQLCHTYSVQRKTNRWPFAYFMNMINVGAIAAFVIHRNVNHLVGKPLNTQRKRFFLTLAEQLTYDHIKRRSAVGLSVQHQETISSVLNDSSTAEPSTSSATPNVRRIKRRCAYCPTTRDRKVRQICQLCKKNVCNKHAISILKCKKCARMPIINSSDSE